MEKAIVLSSGGIDSTTCVGLAVEKYGKENVATISAFYGQKHKKELECAQNVADYYGLKNYVVDLAKIMQYSDCPFSLIQARKSSMRVMLSRLLRVGKSKPMFRFVMG